MRKLLIFVAILLLYQTGLCIETYNPADSVPLCVTTMTGDFLQTADADSISFMWYRLLPDGTFSKIDSVVWDSDSTWGKIATGEICLWVPASDAFGNPGRYQGSIRAYRGDTTDSKIVPWIVKLTKADSLTFRGNPFVYDYGYVIEDFEDTSEWTIEGDAATKVPDYLHRTEGYQGIRVTTAAGDTASITKVIDRYFGGTRTNYAAITPDNFTIAVYDTFSPKWSYSRTDSIVIVFSSQTDFSTQMRATIGQRHFCSEWNKFVLHDDDFTAYGGELWKNRMVRLRIYVFAHAGKSAVLTLDEMRYGYKAEPVVVFTFDDNVINQLPNAVRYALEPNDIEASFHIRSNSMTSALDDSFDIIYEKGNSIESQGWGYDDYISFPTPNYFVDTAYAVAEILNGINYIRSKGWTEPRIYSWNIGWWYPIQLDVLKKTSFMARADVNDDYQAHVELDGRQWYVKGHPIYADTTVASAKEVVDGCIKRGSLTVFIFHSIDTSGATGIGWNRDDLDTLCWYVDSLRDEGQLSCMRLCDYYEALKCGGYVKSIPSRFIDEDSMIVDQSSMRWDLASGGSCNWGDTLAQLMAFRDSITTAIVDANKTNFKATGFAVPGDVMKVNGGSVGSCTTVTQVAYVDSVDTVITQPAGGSGSDTTAIKAMHDNRGTSTFDASTDSTLQTQAIPVFVTGTVADDVTAILDTIQAGFGSQKNQGSIEDIVNFLGATSGDTIVFRPGDGTANKDTCEIHNNGLKRRLIFIHENADAIIDTVFVE